MKNKEIVLPVGLVLTLITGFVGYGQLKEQVKNTTEKVKEVEKDQKEIEDYVAEQRTINVEQKVRLEYIQKLLETVDKKLSKDE